MVEAGEIPDVFSLCFSANGDGTAPNHRPFRMTFPQHNSKYSRQPALTRLLAGGVMTLGATGLPDNAAIQYSPIIQQTYYVVNLTDVLVNGVSIGVNNSVYNAGQAIVDSGTTEYVMPQTAFNALQAAFTALCASQPLVGVCNLGNGTTGLFDGGCFAMEPVRGLLTCNTFCACVCFSVP